MVRLVRITDDTVAVDASGKRDGRGTYLCPELECWEAGLKSSRLEHVLRINLTQDNRERLIKYGRSLAGVSQ